MVNQDPAAQRYIQSIESWGAYDDSPAGREKMDEAFSIIERVIGDFHEVRPYYESICKTSNLPISLCAVYSFVINEYIKPGFWDPSQLCLKQAQTNAQSVILFFPKYRKWVEARHASKAEQMAIFALSSNFLDYYYRSRV